MQRLYIFLRVKWNKLLALRLVYIEAPLLCFCGGDKKADMENTRYLDTKGVNI